MALALIGILGPALLAGTAHAEGHPSITLAVGAPATVLYGSNATVTLTAANPAGQPYGYNLSYRVVLPEGISYVAGSGHTPSGALEPEMLANEPAAGKTTLIWSNVADLSPASSNTLTFQVKHSTSHFTIGNSYTVEAGAYIAEQPRYLPKFTATGTPEGPSSTSFTGFATGAATSTITALQVTQAEESPQGEILRGVHDHQVVYKVTVTNTSVGATGKVLLADWLPADLEYLGCGGAGADHTTDAPTNPGSAEEYPGSGAIIVPALGGCLAASGVETLTTDPDGAEEDPTAVYTHVTWSLGTLAAGESRTIEFRAAVPLRENTTTWTAAEPSVASGEQAANLNNNSGKETTDGESVITFAKATGDYTETVAVSASSHLKRVAKDLTIQKSASSKTLAEGQVTTWTLTLSSSEYRYNTGVVVTDTVPNGLCPLSSANLTTSSECEPDMAPSSPYATASEEANGTWKLVWNASTDSALANLVQNATTTITYETQTRTHYQHEHLPAGPVLANDTVTNTVLAQATTNVVCGDDTDCSGAQKTPINHERPLSEAVSDESSVSQTAEGPSIAKEIAKAGTGCLGDEYTTTAPVYHPGDVICWRLIASFPTTIETKGLDVTDYLPIADTFDEAFEEHGEKGQARAPGDTLPGTTFSHSEASSTEPGGDIKWELPEEGTVNKEKQRFERVYATTAKLPKGASLGELQGNLMKFANVNSPGESFSYRAEADYTLQFPQLSLAKQIVDLNKTPITPTGNETVKGGSEATFAMTVTNAGSLEASGVEVWDELPAGLKCEDITEISNRGVCTAGRIEWGETHVGEEELKVAAKGDTVLNFTVDVPTTVDPSDTFEDHAGVVKYESATNTGGHYLYVPAENIDSLRDSEANAAAANAHAILKTENVTLQKTHTSSVVEASNSAEQATIGEQVTFTVSVTIPAGTTLSGIARLTDPSMPKEQLTLKAGSVEALVNGAAAPGTFKAEESGGSPIVVFPEAYAAPVGESVKVAMRFVTTVANVVVNVHGKSIVNKGKLSWTDPTAGARSLEGENSVPLVEPSITLAETNNSGGPVHGGQLVEYKLAVANAEGASTAFATSVVDKVAGHATVTNSAGTPYKEGEVIESGGVWDEATGTITWSLSPIEPKHESSVTYFVTVNEKPVAGTTLTDTSVATTTSMNGAVSGERTAANDPVSGKPGYESKTGNGLKIEGALIAKGSDSATATIGHRITYTLTVTLPAHVVAYDETVIDTLPDSLDFDEYVSAGCTSGCPPAVTVQTYKPRINASGTTSVAWNLGNIEAAGTARTITIVYRADVRGTHRNGGAIVQAPATISNSALVYYNETNRGSFEELNIPGPGEFDENNGPASATTDVVEPAVTLVKEASVDGGAYSAGPITVTDGDSVRYRLTLSNTGGVDAYGVEARDVIPAQLTEVKETTNAADVTHSWSAGAPEIRWKLPAPLAPNSTETVELGYEAKLISVKSLEPGEEFENAASVPGPYYGVPQAEREADLKNFAGEAIGYREYTGPTTAVKAKVVLPTVTIEKTTGASGFPTSAAAEVGQTFTWRVVVTNTSTVAAKNVHVSDTLPANWEYIKGASFSKGGAIEPSTSGSLGVGEELAWSTAIELTGGASTILTYQAKPILAAESNPGSGAGHPNKNSASVSVQDAAGHSEDAKGPFAAGPSQAQGILDVPVLEVTKRAVKESVAAGMGDSFVITVHNSGAGVAREVLAEDKLPPGMTYAPKSATASPSSGFSEKSASGSSIVWEIASIGAGASVEITVPVGTEASLAGGTHLSNSVAVHAPAAPTPVEATATVTLSTSADLAAAKHVVGSGKAIPGDSLTYEVIATNHGPSTAQEAKLVDHLPAGLTYKSSSPAGCSEAAGVVTCDAGDIEAAHSAAFQIEVQIAAGVSGSISNSVRAESTTPDPEPANNEATATIATSPQAELILEKVALTPEVNDGEEARFSLTASNTGPSDAAEAKITDVLPSGLSYVSASGATCSAAGQEVTCPLGTLDVGSHASVELITHASGPGTRINTATLTSSAEDLEPANNTARAQVIVAPAADLRLTKTVTLEQEGTTLALPGKATYTLVVENAGPDTAKGVVVADPLPAGETYLSDDAGCTVAAENVSCALGELADGEVRTIHLAVTVGTSLGERTVTNTATVTSTTYDPNLVNNTSSASLQTGPAADMSIEKTGPSSVVSGATITWILKARDNGPSTAHEVLVEDPLPGGVTLSGATSSQGACQDIGGVVKCELGVLTDGATAEVRITGTVTTTSGTLQNTAKVRALEPDPEPANNSSSVTTAVLPAPLIEAKDDNANTAAKRTSVSLRKLAASATVGTGENLTYHLIVRDTGSAPALKLRVCDILPSQTTVVSHGEGHLAAGRVCFTLTTLAVGRSRSFKIVLRVDANASGSIVNQAAVTGANFDTVHTHVTTPVRGGVGARRESGVTG